MSAKPRRILLSVRHPSYMRNFLGILDTLAEDGHRLHIVFDKHGPLGEDALFQDLIRRHENISGQFIDSKLINRYEWRHIAKSVRCTFDYFRYLDPRFAEADALRDRAADGAPDSMIRLGKRYLARAPWALRLVQTLARPMEWSLPVKPVVGRVFNLFKPDLVLISPLVAQAADQVDWVKEAKTRRVPSILLVASWDNLTNKGRMRVLPDKVLVWNEAQRREAIDLHGCPPKRVHACGAWTYDHWFDWTPSMDRSTFLAALGLPADARYLLYVGSSPFIAPNEVTFCQRLLEALHAEPTTRDLFLIVRPHPQNAAQWEALDLSALDRVRLHPRAGANPINQNLRNEYFDTIYHSDVVFGVNTSAQIEAGILGRPVTTVTDPRFARSQTGTLHFRHLTECNGGLLHVATTVEEHARMVGALLGQPEQERSAKSRRFVEGFIRPPSLRQTPTQRATAEVEASTAQTVRTEPIARALGTLYRNVVLRFQVPLRLKGKTRQAVEAFDLTSDRDIRI